MQMNQKNEYIYDDFKLKGTLWSPCLIQNLFYVVKGFFSFPNNSDLDKFKMSIVLLSLKINKYE